MSNGWNSGFVDVLLRVMKRWPNVKRTRSSLRAASIRRVASASAAASCEIRAAAPSNAAKSSARSGRGSAFGSKPAPTIKVATNDRLYAQMPDDMDINCGDIVSGGVPIADKGREILEAVLRVASGERTKSEALGLGDNEFVPWQVGAVM